MKTSVRPSPAARRLPVLTDIVRHRIIPVVVCADAARADGLADALVSGGLPVAEVTLRTAAALDTIRVMSARGDLVVGAGTVLTPDQVDLAAQAGATFVVSPGLDGQVVARARARGLAVLPGCLTPTEIMAALALGLTTVKFFPAATFGGVAAIQALSAPFGEIRVVPTGGVGPADLDAYLALPAVAAVGGSWMVPSDAIAAGDFDRIAALTAEAVAAAAGAR